MKPFNHNIKFLRQKKGLSQREFGELLGVNRGNIATYEKKSNAPDQVKQALAEQFDIDLSKILTDEMNDDNYLSFFVTYKEPESDVASEPLEKYGDHSLLELIDSLSESELKKSIKAKVIKLMENDAEQKEKIIALHEYKDKLLKILRDEGYTAD